MGGDLSPDRLLLAYAHGIFPWYSDPSPILWWSPDPRLVLFPDELRISHSLRRVLKKRVFTMTVDADFPAVIRACAEVRTSAGGETWITPEMMESYIRLHRLGCAHSVESWLGGELAGGLYGIAMGRAFFGESMFTRVTDASKAAFVYLVELVRELGFEFVDCQTTTAHLKSFGAREIPRREFLMRLSLALDGEWRSSFNPPE